MKVSVVIPTLNQQRFLASAVCSARFGSSGIECELIVIDGGSTDGTVELLRAKEDRLAYWISEPDRGQSHAINKGLARATGDILAYLNSDDVYLPGALEAVARAVRDNPDADLFYGRCRMIDAQGRPLPRVFAGDISSAEEALDLWGVWWNGRNFVQPEVFWTRRIMERVGPFREDLHYAMDYDYWVRCFLAGAKAVRIDADLAAFRLWEGQKSRASDRAAAELRQVVREHLEDPSTPIAPAVRRRLSARLAYDEEFLPLVARSVEAGEGRLRRWARVGRLLIRRPGLATSRPFWARLGAVTGLGALSRRRAAAGTAGG